VESNLRGGRGPEKLANGGPKKPGGGGHKREQHENEKREMRKKLCVGSS
jgi:hypothetical protein